ncbi:hypothetical protein ACSS6W_008388 [Trichoderma asperelloides]
MYPLADLNKNTVITFQALQPATSPDSWRSSRIILQLFKQVTIALSNSACHPSILCLPRASAL